MGKLPKAILTLNSQRQIIPDTGFGCWTLCNYAELWYFAGHITKPVNICNS